MKVFRYSINMGESGGVVIAPSMEVADVKIRMYHEEHYKQPLKDEDEVLIWDWEDDEYYVSDCPDVIDCYGC